MGLPTIAEDNDLMLGVHEPLFQTGCLSLFPAGEEYPAQSLPSKGLSFDWKT